MSLNVRFHAGQMVIQFLNWLCRSAIWDCPAAASCRAALVTDRHFRETAAACSPGWQHRSL